eukprot:9264663-Pyramimonas_sp.AAC.1
MDLGRVVWRRVPSPCEIDALRRLIGRQQLLTSGVPSTIRGSGAHAPHPRTTSPCQRAHDKSGG